MIGSHGVDEQAQRGGVEDDRVDGETIEVRGRRLRGDTDDVGALVPGVLESPEPVGEGTAAVGEADPEVRADPIESAAEDHGEDRQLGLRGHAHEPLGHPAVGARAGRHVPGMDEHRHADARTVLEEGDDAGVVEIAVSDVVADLDAEVAVGE